MNNNFNWKKLGGATSKIGSGKTPLGGSEVYKDSGVLFIRSQNVRSNSLDITKPTFIDEDTHNGMKGSRVLPGDVLLNITGASIGRACVFPEGGPEANVNQHVCIIRLKDELHPDYLSYFLNSWHGQKQIYKNLNAGTREGLNFQQIGEIEIPYIDEVLQDSLVKILKKYASEKDQFKRLLTLKRKRRSALIGEVLLGKRRFSDFDDDWKTVCLGDFFKEKSVKNKEDLDLTILSCSKVYGIVPQTDIFDKRIASEDVKRYKIVEAGDLVYDPMLLWDASIGFSEKVDKGLISPAYNVFEFVGDSETKTYFKILFKSHYFRHMYKKISQGTNTRRRKAPAKDFLKIEFKVPSKIDEKVKISELFSLLNEEIRLLEKKLELIVETERGLVSDFFNKKIKSDKVLSAGELL